MCAWLAGAPRTRPWKAAVPQTAAEPASEQPPASSMSKHLPPSVAPWHLDTTWSSQDHFMRHM